MKVTKNNSRLLVKLLTTCLSATFPQVPAMSILVDSLNQSHKHNFSTRSTESSNLLEIRALRHVRRQSGFVDSLLR
jgi:hypothetical protein